MAVLCNMCGIFGGGQRGGGEKIAHVFGAPGDSTVTLTVVDGAGRSASITQTISIMASATPSTPVIEQVLVHEIDGTPIAGVTINPSSAATAASDAQGKVSVTLNAGTQTALKFSKAGYADQFLNLTLPSGVGADGYFEVTMRARDAALALMDAGTGGTLTGRDGATITVPANAFIDASGAVVSGAVQMSITPVDVTQAGAGGFPGGFEGVQSDGTKTSIVSAGVNEFMPTANGAPIQLAPGKSATITIPIYAAKKLDGTLIAVGDVIPLWSLDEVTGIWIQEGTGTVIASDDSPSGLALSATVTHLSWWNCDFGFYPYGPKPTCVPDQDPESDDPFLNSTLCDVFAAIYGDDTDGSGSQVKTAAKPRHQSVHTGKILLPIEVAFYRQYVVPIAGGQSVAVPADTNVLLTAYAANGTWTGTAVVNGVGGAETPVTITLHKVGQATTTPEAITLPFNDSRSVPAAGTAQFTFTTTTPSVIRIKIAPNANSFFTGSVSLLQGSTTVGTAAVSNGELEQVVAYVAAGTYMIAANIDRAAAFRLQVDAEPSDAQVQPITLPFDGERSLLPNATAIFSFSGVANQFARIVVETPTDGSGGETSLSGQVQLLLNGAVIGSATLSGTSTQLVVPLTAAGTVTISITGAVGESVQLSADLEGDTQAETLTLPTDVTRSIAAEGLYRGSFTLTTATAVFLDSRNLSGDSTDVKLLKSDGTVLFDAPPNPTESDATNSFVSTLQPGTYTVQVSPQNAKAASERLTLAVTSWAPVAPTLPANGLAQTVNLVMDGNDKPVVGYVDLATAGQSSHVLKLRRWTGTAWETVGSDLVTGSACESTDGASFALDSSNNPVVMYAVESATDESTYFIVQRWNGTAWVAVGPNGGHLPSVAPSNSVCDRVSTTLVGPDNQPVVVYPTSSGPTLLHFNGSAWVGYVTPAGDVVGNPTTTGFDARFDPSGKLWRVTGTDGNNANGGAQRLNTSTHAWDAVGSGFPQVGTIGLQQPHLRFDSTGSPVVAFLADVGANFTSHGGVAVYRFDGTNWQTDGGHDASSVSTGANIPDPAFVLFNDQAVLGWLTDLDVTQDPVVGTVVTQTNTASGWSAIGGGMGALSQYSATGASQSYAADPFLATDGTDIYLSVIAEDLYGPFYQSHSTALTLLKKVAN